MSGLCKLGFQDFDSEPNTSGSSGRSPKQVAPIELSFWLSYHLEFSLGFRVQGLGFRDEGRGLGLSWSRDHEGIIYMHSCP